MIKNIIDYLYISGLEQKLTNKISKLYETNLNFKKKLNFENNIVPMALLFFIIYKIKVFTGR